MATLTGIVFKGTGAAPESLKPLMAHIRTRSGLEALRPGTLNVRLTAPYCGHNDFEFAAQAWNHHEDVYFERCRVLGLDALIMRTSTNYHGEAVLELMAEKHFHDDLGVVDGQAIEVEVFENE